ncbi:putative DNA modification/repair radical SAM protein [Desulfitobacterium dichloroeliminans LMG P-21439]|uniref:Putative DNA modification/repair radical SAM protein n=1 Tax=Desulfitobacterium dichloroeliminans (strain LMG P-21439 / DCA1) TaxID=871963 RepID=L0F9Y4_DESDL|nr:putative DNA modification/repair radical SAM protein [Desulfitobacterium dichloroeliminans]AGA70002.1 putative DNA modification/repair radical SAM protein [Desulfitobacterium dichloroeliminans LMG P-21439]
MDIFDKLTILADSAKYDVACTSSGVERKGSSGSIGSAAAAGICHSFAADGRCISLLKVLLTNFCVYDCKYCINRSSNDIPRASFTPRELAELTINFYRRNYIEGLFLSSAVIKDSNYTSELLIRTLELLREEYRFAGYIHVKVIPGTDNEVLTRLGYLADRVSINIELPSQESLRLLAPDKSKESILRPMGLIKGKIAENSTDLIKYRHAQKFVPAGQSTQLIVGATPDTDYKILTLAEGLYNKYQLKRVFFSAYIPVAEHSLLPAASAKPPLMREHRLYQADWLLRFYGFQAQELLDESHPNFNLQVDPKCNWALNHMDQFPVEINQAPYEILLRVPGIGVTSARRILRARKISPLDFTGLKKLGVVLKRAQYFVLCKGKTLEGLKLAPHNVMQALMSERVIASLPSQVPQQLSLFEDPPISREDVVQCLTGQL